MSIKKLVRQLEKHINVKFPEYHAKFYSNRRKAKRMVFRNDNKFIPKYVPNNLKWYKRGGLETWYLQNKCNDFLMDTDEHFKETKVVNFDITKNKKLEEEKLKQYQTIDHDEIMKYPAQ